MIYKKTTKSNIRMFSDDVLNMKALSNTAKKLSSSYEIRVVEDHFVVAVDFFLGTNLPQTERKVLIDEIYGVFEEELTKAK